MPNCRRLFHSPIIKYSTILVRHVATDKRAFYLLNTTSQGPQIYELVAGSGSERTKWMKHITELATLSQKPDLLGLEKSKGAVRSESFREAPSSPRLDRTDRQNSSPPEGFNIPRNATGESSGDAGPGPPAPSVPKKRLQRVEILKIVDSPPMVDPSQVVVNQARIMVAAPVTTPLEKLKQKDEEVSRILDEKQKLISEILDINEDEFDTVADVASSRTGGDRDARDILLAALDQARSLTSFVNSNLRVTEEDLVTRRDTLDTGGAQLVQITTSMNHHLTDLLAIMADRDTERDGLRRELAKCQNQIRGFFRPESGAAPVSSSSRPTSFISVESDGGAESSGSGDTGARPHSLLSFSSDNFPLEADTDPDTRSQVRSQRCPQVSHVSHNVLQTSPVCQAVNGLASHEVTDIDLTPTEEAAPSPGPASTALCDSRVTSSDSDGEEIVVTSSVKVNNIT